MLALTMGDPAGIGPELTLRAWRLLRDGGPAFVALADPAQLATLDPGVPLQLVSDPADAFKTPVAIRFVPETVPRNANGKILKKDLQSLFADRIPATAS